MAAAKNKTPLAPREAASVTLKLIVDGLRRAEEGEELEIGHRALDALHSHLRGLTAQGFKEAVSEIVRFAQFLMVEQKSQAGGTSLLAIVERVIAGQGLGKLTEKKKAPAKKAKAAAKKKPKLSRR